VKDTLEDVAIRVSRDLLEHVTGQQLTTPFFLVDVEEIG
jgi:hypothetical protein